MEENKLGFPVGRSISKKELLESERALYNLLYGYRNEVLRSNLVQQLHTTVRENPNEFVILESDIKSVGKHYTLLQAADTLISDLAKKIEKQLAED